MDIKQRDSRRIIAATTGDQCSLVINMTPFTVDVVCADKLVVSVNSRSLLRFNIGRAKSGYVTVFLPLTVQNYNYKLFHCICHIVVFFHLKFI